MTTTEDIGDLHLQMDGFVTFRVAEQWLGIPVVLVQEVLVEQRISPVPLSPDEVAGFLNLRGQIVTAIELRARLGLPPREDTAQDDDEPVPTLPPSDGGDTGDPADEGDGGGASTGTIIGLALAILAIAAAIAFATRVLTRRFRP
ncbi:MAG: chemotaxis protein CheW [Chloroflexi bacterium]|nr:chemotaxis protein CheW [Chloroflexota bacterium]